MKAPTQLMLATALLGILGTTGLARTVNAVQFQQPVHAPTHFSTQLAEKVDPANDNDSEVQDEKVPTSLTQIGEYGEDIYDLAKVNNWTKAKISLLNLQKAVKQLDTERNILQSEVVRLTSQVNVLERAIATKNRPATMHNANQVTLVVAQMTKPFEPKIPTDITLLDYYGRELEIWSTPGNPTKLEKTVQDLNRTWKTVRPDILKHGGRTKAHQFDNLVARVNTAKSPAAYSHLATPILDAVDQLEAVFK